MSCGIRGFGATHPGRRRGNNEDSFCLNEALGAAIVADGMGGESCGEIGSRMTIRVAVEHLSRPESDLTLTETALEAIRAANSEVIAAARVRPGCNGMGSTIVMALWRLPEMLIANVGDSRAYLLREGKLRQLSYDQSFANELRHKLGFSEERIRAMANRNVLTMAVGTFEQVLILTHSELVQGGDCFLLCSDGLYGPVTDSAISAILQEPSSLQERAEKLINTANQNGGPDNVTAVLLEVFGETDE